ncbi:ABC transporter ATP-binding protein [Xaviernesmea oryzae]|nr:ABC transporter ATP-binding protein [Xaviernesmea oryzae]
MKAMNITPLSGHKAPASTSATRLRDVELTVEPVISAKNVGYMFEGGLKAIDGLNFDLSPGEVVSIVGPSGCGKSTLLRLISNLREPTSGHVERNFGKGGRHGCSMVFQEDTLLPWLTVEKNVGLYYRFNRSNSANAKAHIRDLLEMVKLGPYAKFYPYQLSGGMRRRVAILTAIAPRPDLLLLDEPFSALDEPTRIALHSDLHMLIKELRISALLVTHDLAEAASLSDRVLILSRAPAHVVQEVQIPFGNHRDMYELRGRKDFLDLYSDLWNTLKGQIERVS